MISTCNDTKYSIQEEVVPKLLIGYMAKSIPIYVLWLTLVISTFCGTLELHMYFQSQLILGDVSVQGSTFRSLIWLSKNILRSYLHHISNGLVIIMTLSCGTEILQLQ